MAGVVAVWRLAIGGELVTLKMVDDNTVTAGMLMRHSVPDATWADGQQAAFRARFVAEEAAREEEGVAEQGKREAKEVAAQLAQHKKDLAALNKMRTKEEKEKVDALYAREVHTMKQTATNAQQVCALSLSFSKRVYSGHKNTHWSWKRLCPLCMEKNMGLDSQKCCVCRF